MKAAQPTTDSIVLEQRSERSPVRYPSIAASCVNLDRRSINRRSFFPDISGQSDPFNTMSSYGPRKAAPSNLKAHGCRIQVVLPKGVDFNTEALIKSQGPQCVTGFARAQGLVSKLLELQKQV